MEQEAVNAAQPVALDEEKTAQVAGGQRFFSLEVGESIFDFKKPGDGSIPTPTPVRPKPIDK